MGGFFLGLLDLLIGLGFVVAGLRVFFAVLPIAAFFIGGYVAALAVHQLFDEGFLNTSLSLLVGFGVGMACAIAAYLIWYVGALILAGATGALLGSGVVAAFNDQADVLTFVVALIAAAAAVWAAYQFYLPTWVIIICSSMIGAAVTILGAMIVLNRVEVEELSEGPALAVVNHSWFWVLAWAIISGIGIWIQYTTTTDIVLPEGRWSRLQPETYARVGRRAS
ncbi:MAG TPA: DUF4203 domain-containing protein [Thermomicrobiales bacterium]|nr:DUF4203 domain-containing protein [Thermomicrobiales bacterium]